MQEMTGTFTMISCIHIYKDIRNPSVGEIVICEREPKNPRNPYMITLWKDRIIVGHVP